MSNDVVSNAITALIYSDHGRATNAVTRQLQTIRSRLHAGKLLFNLTKHSTHFDYHYINSNKWLMIIHITRCRHFVDDYNQLAARQFLYAPSHRQDLIYHSCGSLVETRTKSVGPLRGINQTPYNRK